MSNYKELRASATTDVKALAGMVSKTLDSGLDVEIVYIGAGSGHQSVKAIIQARMWHAAKGECLAIIPGFRNIVTNEGETTANFFRIIKLHQSDTIRMGEVKVDGPTNYGGHAN